MLSSSEDNCGKRVVFPVLRLGLPDASGAEPLTFEGYWEIEYQGRSYPWRPVRPEDELDLPRLMRGAMAYLEGDLQRHG